MGDVVRTAIYRDTADARQGVAAYRGRTMEAVNEDGKIAKCHIFRDTSAAMQGVAAWRMRSPDGVANPDTRVLIHRAYRDTANTWRMRVGSGIPIVRCEEYFYAGRVHVRLPCTLETIWGVRYASGWSPQPECTFTIDMFCEFVVCARNFASWVSPLTLDCPSFGGFGAQLSFRIDPANDLATITAACRALGQACNFFVYDACPPRTTRQFCFKTTVTFSDLVDGNRVRFDGINLQSTDPDIEGTAVLNDSSQLHPADHSNICAYAAPGCVQGDPCV